VRMGRRFGGAVSSPSDSSPNRSTLCSRRKVVLRIGTSQAPDPSGNGNRGPNFSQDSPSRGRGPSRASDANNAPCRDEHARPFARRQTARVCVSQI
jgi:hypothetical protein